MDEIQIRYESIVETTPDVVVIMDEAGDIVMANAALERVLGYLPSDVVGKPLAVLMPERFRSGHHAGLERYLKTKVRKLDWRSIRLPGLAKDGREIPLDISFGEFSENGRCYFTGIMRDMTVAQKASDTLEFLTRVGPELAASSLDYQETLKALANLAVPFLADWCTVDIIDESGKTVRLAVAHSDPAKVSFASELQERYPADPDASFGLPNVLRTGKSEHIEEIPPSLIESVARDKEHLELINSLGLKSYAIVPLIKNDHVYGALSLVMAESGRCITAADMPFLEDIGRRAGLAIHNAHLYRDAQNLNIQLKEQAIELENQTEEAQAMAEELEEQADELIQKSRELERKTVDAEAANSAKSQFLANMSHELRTPLNAIAGYAQLLEMEVRGPLTEPQKIDLRRLRVSQEHLLSLIDNILAFAKVDSGKLEYDIQPVSVYSISTAAEAMIQPQAEAKGVRCAYEGCDEEIMALADPDKLQQILLNLLGNAIKFTERGGMVILSCSSSENGVELKVQDTGKGIDPEKIESIFEPFVQLDRELSRPQEGVGLGLAISRNLARGMDGEIRVESEPGRGSIFTLHLPAAGEAAS